MDEMDDCNEMTVYTYDIILIVAGTCR